MSEKRGAQRGLADAHPGGDVPAPPGVVDPGVPHVLFSVAGRNLAVPASACKGVLRESRFTRVPGVPPWVLGVVAFRGEVVSLTDPARLLRLGRDPASSAPGYVLMLARGDEKVGLWVDRVVDVVPMTAPRPPDAAMPWEGCPEGLLRGQVSPGAETVFFLDAPRYVESTGPGGRAGRRPRLGAPGA